MFYDEVTRRCKKCGKFVDSVTVPHGEDPDYDVLCNECKDRKS